MIIPEDETLAAGSSAYADWAGPDETIDAPLTPEDEPALDMTLSHINVRLLVARGWIRMPSSLCITCITNQWQILLLIGVIAIILINALSCCAWRKYGRIISDLHKQPHVG